MLAPGATAEISSSPGARLMLLGGADDWTPAGPCQQLAAVIALLALHLSEVVLWSAALVWGGIVPDWSKAAYFAANCYTALGEPFSLPHEWRIVPPIIAMSGIFAFGWTASVFVNFVARYNELRASILQARR